MPNGDTTGVYNIDWCKDRHSKLDRRLELLESRFWSIILLMFGNLAGVVGIIITLWVQG